MLKFFSIEIAFRERQISSFSFSLLVYCRSHNRGWRPQRFKDVRAHCYCAFLLRTLFIRHARATSYIERAHLEKHLTKCSANGRCVNLVREYFCWMHSDPHFFFGKSLPFLILSIITKNKKILCVGSFNYFAFTIHMGSTELLHKYRCA